MLKLNALSFRVDKKHLIDAISLTFEPGFLYGVLGPNGCGKTTLLKTIAGIWNPSSGNVFWKEENLHAKERLEISKIISFVPQNVQTHFDFSVFELVAMGRYPYGQESLEPLKEAMYAVDVWHLREQNISTLSAGEKQRVYIARALATAAPVLLLDEPTANLDIRHQLEIWSLLKKLVTEGKIVIVTTHDLAATEEYCDSVVILNEGRYVTKGPYAISVDEQLLRDVFGIKKVNTPLPLKFREFP